MLLPSVRAVRLILFVVLSSAVYGGQVSSADLTAATVFALEYGYPLLAYAKVASHIVPVLGTNTLYATGRLSNPGDSVVIAPNVDTLYAFAMIDLSVKDVIVTVPRVDAGRYFSFAFYDPFGSNYAVLSSLRETQAGKYDLRWTKESEASWGYKPPLRHDKYSGRINAPTAHGILLIRILVRNNGTDLLQAQSLLARCKLTAVARSRPAPTKVEPLSSAAFEELASLSTPLQILTLGARLFKANPPFGDVNRNAITAQLSQAGLRDGVYHQPTGANITAAWVSVQTAIASYRITGQTTLNNGWSRYIPQGLYGDNFVARAFAGAALYLALQPSETIYPIFNGANSMQLAKEEAYLISFSSKPPITKKGFWSLTLYNATGSLVENPLGVYSLGDRSGITYANGTLVYGSLRSDTGSFQILIQPMNVAPPVNWTNNWLPAPEYGDIFSIALRLYSPTSALTDGSWQYPVVARTKAIVA